MRIIVVNRQQIIDLIISNLATAGIIEQKDMKFVSKELEPVSDEELITVLIKSIQMQEDTGKADAMPIVPIGEISLN